MEINKILIKPILTEKATNLVKNQVYAFEVNLKANKHQIKEALQKLYQVQVKGVRVMLKKGKTRRVGRRLTPKRLQARKIAYVTISQGKIDLFPQT